MSAPAAIFYVVNLHTGRVVNACINKHNAEAAAESAAADTGCTFVVANGITWTNGKCKIPHGKAGVT